MLRAPSSALLSIAATVLISAVTFSWATSGAAAATDTPASVAHAQAQPAATGTRAFTGPGSCAAAACHGAIRPVAGSRILQTEYTTWIAQDRHARAAEVLSNPVSVRMARILGLPAANTAAKCLACHTLAAPQAQQARTFVSEGVSCEACHGPASGWLGPHTTKGWTHAQSVQAGMTDTKDLVKRTDVCLSCHLGTADKFVDHEMIAAGHPDLVFDLEAFSAAMPRHWRPVTEADPFAPVRAFSVGQLVHLRSHLERVARRIKSPVWPEYAELDCFACHHSLTRAEDSWRQSLGYDNRRPGNPALNMSRWVTARHVLALQDPAAAATLNDVMTSVAREASRLRPNEEQVISLAARARTVLDGAIARALTTNPDAATANRLLRAIIADVEEIAPRGERAAEQAAMAVETLALAGAQVGEGSALRAAFDELFATFQSPSGYDPRRFVAQIRKIESALAK
jgi:hypothetical protein